MKYTLFISLLICSSAFAQVPDIILFNGKIFTADKNQLYVEAIAVRGNKIAAIGSNEKINSLAGSATRKIDLQGKTVIPGINDAHYHHSPFLLGRTMGYPQDGREPGWQELKDSIAVAVASVPKGTFIHGTIGIEVGTNEKIDRYELDKLAPDHPLILGAYWGHIGILNSAAIKALKIPENIPDPKGGKYGRDASGKINGRLYEYARFGDDYTRFTNDELMLASLQALTGEASYFGVTTIQNMCTGATPSTYLRLLKKIPFPTRLRLIRWSSMSAAGNLNVPDPTINQSGEKFTHYVNGTKWLLDGTPIERFAENSVDYKDQPGWKGKMNFSEADIQKMIAEAAKRKDPLMIHAVGNTTIEAVLKKLDEIKIKNSLSRPRIEHGDGLLPAYYELAKRNNIVVVQNPTHLALPQILHSRWQAELENKGQPVKSLLNAGIPVALGSDGPLNPYLNIMLACMHPFRPNEALTVEEAVIAYTLTSAYAEHADTYKGSLTVGKVADLAVLSQDIFTVPLPQLPGTSSVLTMIDGKIVWQVKTQ